MRDEMADDEGFALPFEIRSICLAGAVARSAYSDGHQNRGKAFVSRYGYFCLLLREVTRSDMPFPRRINHPADLGRNITRCGFCAFHR